MNLGDLINCLRGLEDDYVVEKSWCGPHSYRGIYAHLAFEPAGPRPVGRLLPEAYGCIDRTFEGHKGGSFRMNRETPIWLANYGEVCDCHTNDWDLLSCCEFERQIEELLLLQQCEIPL